MWPLKHRDIVVSMISTSKIALSQSQIAQVCQSYLGSALVSSQENNEGWFNTLHMLKLADGRRVVLKLAPNPAFQAMRYEQGILQTELGVHRFLHSKGCLVPEILAQSLQGDVLGVPWFIMEHLEGITLGAYKKDSPRDFHEAPDRAVARQTAQINALTGTQFGRWGSCAKIANALVSSDPQQSADSSVSSSWATSFTAMVADLIADAHDKNVDLGPQGTSIPALIASRRSALDQVSQPRLVLWDLHDGNVMVHMGSNKGALPLAAPVLSGFLDTDRALWGDPLMEFYFRDLAQTPPWWAEEYRSTWASIQGAGPNPLDLPGADLRLELYDLYLALVMYIECAFRGFDVGHEAWARGRYQELLHKALSRKA